jgi:hypothetical protein
MPIGALIGAGASLLGGSMNANAAQASAQANLEAARIAAEAQKFRPVGVTTRFGSSNFVTDPNTGYVTSAGYNVAPDVAAMRDRLLSQAGGQGFQTAEQAQQAQQSLFNLGQGYLAQSPEAAAQQWMKSQQALLQPGRENAYANLQQNLFNSGRGGLAIAQGGGMGASNPEAQAYYNAMAQQDKQLAADATAQGRAQTQFGAGLFGTGLDIATQGYNPLKTQFGLGQTMEQSGQGALDLGVNIGGQQTQAASNAAGTIYNAQRGVNAANAISPIGSMLSGAAGNSQLTSGIANWFSPSAPTANASTVGYMGADRGMWF